MRFLIFITILLTINVTWGKEELYVYNDNINNLYSNAIAHFKNTDIKVFKEIRGITISFSIENIESEFYTTGYRTEENLKKIGNFLAKIENPVIIEVHTGKNSQINTKNLRAWEITTVVANRIEPLLAYYGKVSHFRIKSVGYGEFFPSKNTPNNGVKNSGRVDIIILCSINGE